MLAAIGIFHSTLIEKKKIREKLEKVNKAGMRVMLRLEGWE